MHKKFKLINKIENSKSVDSYVFEILVPETIECWNCNSKKIKLYKYYLRKNPVFLFKNDKLNRLFFRVPIIHCENCKRRKTYNADFFEMKSVRPENFFELAKNL